MENNERIIAELIALFGSDVYLENGKLNRKYLADIVFQDKNKLEQLNAIVHPAVGMDGINWHHTQKNVPFTLKEAALFFENGSYVLMDKMITVTAPEALRIQRVIARDKTSVEAVKARINKQLPEAEKVKKSDFVIVNDGKHSLILQVLDIYKQLEKVILKDLS